MCECTSTIPGVTYLPVPSITKASVGALIETPTAAIFPSRNNTEPLRIDGPAAVIIVAFRIRVGRPGKGRYVLGNGFAFGSEVPPGPGGVAGGLSELALLDPFGCCA